MNPELFNNNPIFDEKQSSTSWEHTKKIPQNSQLGKYFFFQFSFRPIFRFFALFYRKYVTRGGGYEAKKSDYPQKILASLFLDVILVCCEGSKKRFLKKFIFGGLHTKNRRKETKELKLAIFKTF